MAIDSSYGNADVNRVSANLNVLASKPLPVKSNSIAAQFESWYSTTYNGKSPRLMNHLSSLQRDMIFSKFIHSDIISQKLLAICSKNLIFKFNTTDHKQAETVFGWIIHGKNIA